MYRYDEVLKRVYQENTHLDTQNNVESVFIVGNGRYAIRGTYEEKHPYEQRGVFRAGVYGHLINRVEELLTFPDPSHINIRLNGQLFHLSLGQVIKHERYLDLSTFELVRHVIWESSLHQRFDILFKRFFSFDEPNLFVQSIEIKSDDADAHMIIETGVDAKNPNRGLPFISDMNKRVHQQKLMESTYLLNQKHLPSVTYTTGIIVDHQWVKGTFVPSPLSLVGKYAFSITKNTSIKITKPTWICLSDEKCAIDLSIDPMYDYEYLHQQSMLAYHPISHTLIRDMEAKSNILMKLWWSSYHIQLMTPHFDHASIGAKGLTGDGYLGHVFWDTEMFMLRYYLWMDPDIVKSCLLYRYKRLNESKKLAKDRGYQGAMVPWESAQSGYDQTPEWSAINIHTGLPTRIYSGLKELHITADVMYMIILYVNQTGDLAFMESYGRKMLSSYALFWLSKMQLTDRGYEILDVIGPDEYTEHVNNNYYTNYLVKMCFYYARPWIKDKKLLGRMKHAYHHMYLPPSINGILQQDDTFMSKPIIDIEKYRQQAGSQAILKDYSREEVIGMQVLKQADTVMLFELFHTDFDRKTIEKTYQYYEHKTIHDSSLSKASHAIVACDLKNMDEFERYFMESLDIDFKESSHSSTGIHAASMYRPSFMLIRSILGLVHHLNGTISIYPIRQQLIDHFTLTLKLNQSSCLVNYGKDRVSITIMDGPEVSLIYEHETYRFQHEIIFTYQYDAFHLQHCS